MGLRFKEINNAKKTWMCPFESSTLCYKNENKLDWMNELKKLSPLLSLKITNFMVYTSKSSWDKPKYAWIFNLLEKRFEKEITLMGPV